jgi:PAS domain S-box-containing protein
LKSDSKKRILLVEDDSFVAMMGMRTLTINNFDVVHVNSGEKAIELIDSDPYFDMVLMDIDLGIGMEGTDAAKIILERHDVPLVFLSSHTEPEIVKKTEDITSFGYIVKDSGETVLIASIKMAFKLFDSIKKERQLKESDYNYKQLFSNMMSAFAIHELVYDKNGEAVDYRFVEVNPFFEEITGLVAKEIIGKTVLEVLPNTESYWIEYYAKVVKTGKTFNFSQYSQGLGKYYDVLAFPIGEKGFATIFNDVTEHKIISDTQEFIINTFHNAEENFFEALARFLSELFGVSCVMIGKYSNGYVDTLAMHFNGESHAKISYPVKNMPCQKVIEQHICYYQHSVCEHYPSCEMLQQIGAESFLGISLISKSGSPIGLISLIDTKPLIKESIHEKVLRVVSVRTTEEIERETNDELIHNLLQTNELQLKESHHRMKNNMNTMYSLLMIKADEHKGTDAEEILIDSAKYLSSMRILYDNLFYYNTFSKLDLKLFVHGLVHDILQANYIKVQIHSNFDVDEIELIPDVLSSLGLIINELISNSIKHGFQDDGENHIWLSAKEIEDKLVIKFKNSGLKLPDDFDLSSSKGFGMQLISALVSQHKGVFYNLSGNRTEFVIEIPLRDIKK